MTAGTPTGGRGRGPNEAPLDPVALRHQLKRRARDVGFARVGVARAERLDREAPWLERWLEEGLHGGMDWLAKTADVRLDPCHEHMLASARSVVVLAAPYARPEDGEPAGLPPGRVARYARGRDYHNVLRRRARKLARWLQRLGHRTRVSVDREPVWERAWAARAGVGFVGKHCCLIVPGLGSHVLLTTLVTEAELPADPPMAERCGSCTLCLQACPTEAFPGPRRLDARRCLSYLTIEHDGPLPDGYRVRLGDHLFGCDDCQDVCPYNRTRPPDLEQTQPFAADPERWTLRLRDLLDMDESTFLRWAHGSPLRRAGLRRLQRNAALVLGNAGGPEDLPALRRAAEHHPDPTVREAARWALARLARRPPTP